MKRRYPIAFACLTLVAVLAFFNQALAANIIDSYSETNQSTVLTLDNFSTAGGQTFTATATTLDSAVFFLQKFGSPTGNATAKIYNETGTFGTDATPTGAALATSDTFDVSTLTTSFQLITLNFSGANRISLTNGTHYAITFEWSGGTSANKVQIGLDGTSPTHAGNLTYLSGIWTFDNTFDAVFYVYGVTATVSFPTVPVSNSQRQGATVVTGGMMVTK